MYVTLGNNQVEVVIERKNNKNIYFRIKEDLRLHITCNKWVSEREVKRLIESNNDSLTKMYNKMNKQIEKDEHFYYLGEPYTVVIDHNAKKTYFDDDLVITGSYKELEKFYLKECKRVFEERIDKISWLIPFVPEFKLRIRKMKTRWGVCNRTRKVVTLNSELLKKEVTIIDYVIVHELCHFKHPHHQKPFWDEVSKYYPEWRQARKIIKE